jgi:TDG/mug DNA glycosylase family protein
VCERGAVPRPTRAELEAARALTVPDVLPGPDDPPCAVLFCGINPGLVTALTGHHFGRPGNRFWPALHRSSYVAWGWASRTWSRARRHGRTS